MRRGQGHVALGKSREGGNERPGSTWHVSSWREVVGLSRWKPLGLGQVAERQVGKDWHLEGAGKKGGRGEGPCSSPPQVAPCCAGRGEAEGSVGFTPVADLALGSGEVICDSAGTWLGGPCCEDLAF